MSENYGGQSWTPRQTTYLALGAAKKSREDSGQHSRHLAAFPMNGTDQLKPTCPHCRREFPSWSHAKFHVKHCKAGKPRKTVARRIAEFNARQTEFHFLDR